MLLFLVLPILGLVAVLPVGAAQFEVTTLADGSDAAPGDGHCATSTGECSLRAAVEEANAMNGFDTVALAAGVYEIVAPEVPDQNDAGQIDIAGDLEIIGAGADATFIDGGGVAAMFNVLPGFRLRIATLTLRNGDGAFRPVVENWGELLFDRIGYTGNKGSMYDASIRSHWNLTVRDSVFEHNEEYVIETWSGSLLLDGVVMRHNDGPVYSDGGGVVILRSQISENNGGVWGCVSVIDSAIRDNTGGGIYCPGSGVVVTRSTISGNGGVGVNSDGSVLIVDSTIAGNGWTSSLEAMPFGIGAVGNGGIVAIGKVTAQRSTFENNIGYGIKSDVGADLENVTIVGNHVGLYLREEVGRVESSTITGNTEMGFWCEGDEGRFVVRNSIVAGNEDDCRGIVESGGFNLLGETCEVSPAETDRVGVDPLLGPPQDNGGPTRTMAPLDGSPALDGFATGEPGACPAFDQRGARRPQGGGCDIGAVERLDACGNGQLDPGENCDDGNNDAGDCCSPLCRFTEILPGDCDGDGRVTVSELVLVVGFAMQRRIPVTCLDADRDADLRVNIAEIIAAVRHALDNTQLECRSFAGEAKARRGLLLQNVASPSL